MAVSEDVVDISERHMLGSLIGMMVDQIKGQVVPYGALPEAAQREIIDRVTRNCREAVRQVVNIIASSGRPHVQAEINSVAFTDKGLAVKLAVSKLQAARHELSDAVGDAVIVVLPNWEGIEDADGAPKAEPDQQRLDGVDPPADNDA